MGEQDSELGNTNRSQGLRYTREPLSRCDVMWRIWSGGGMRVAVESKITPLAVSKILLKMHYFKYFPLFKIQGRSNALELELFRVNQWLNPIFLPGKRKVSSRNKEGRKRINWYLLVQPRGPGRSPGMSQDSSVRGEAAPTRVVDAFQQTEALRDWGPCSSISIL